MPAKKKATSPVPTGLGLDHPVSKAAFMHGSTAKSRPKPLQPVPPGAPPTRGTRARSVRDDLEALHARQQAEMEAMQRRVFEAEQELAADEEVEEETESHCSEISEPEEGAGEAAEIIEEAEEGAGEAASENEIGGEEDVGEDSPQALPEVAEPDWEMGEGEKNIVVFWVEAAEGSDVGPEEAAMMPPDAQAALMARVQDRGKALASVKSNMGQLWVEMSTEASAYRVVQKNPSGISICKGKYRVQVRHTRRAAWPSDEAVLDSMSEQSRKNKWQMKKRAQAHQEWYSSSGKPKGHKGGSRHKASKKGKSNIPTGASSSSAAWQGGSGDAASSSKRSRTR